MVQNQDHQCNGSHPQPLVLMGWSLQAGMPPTPPPASAVSTDRPRADHRESVSLL